MPLKRDSFTTMVSDSAISFGGFQERPEKKVKEGILVDQRLDSQACQECQVE